MRRRLGRLARVLGVVALAWVALGAKPAAAQTVMVHTDRAAWETALAGSFSEETFDDALLPPGVSFVSTAGSINSGQFNDRLDEPGFTQWNFATGTHGFGGNWDLSPGGQGTGIQVTLDFLSGGNLVLSSEIPNSLGGQFWGFTSDTLFDQVVLREGTQGGAAETYTMDNLVYGTSNATAAAVPEPATLLLLLPGLAAVGVLKRRRNAEPESGDSDG